MGEALLKDAIAKLPASSPLHNLRVISAGTFGEDGMDASPYSVQVLHKIGIDLKNHLAQTLTKKMLNECFALITMTKAHLDTTKHRFPNDMPPHAFTLLSLLEDKKYDDVLDPYGYNIQTYTEVRDEIASAIPALVKYLEKELK